MALIHGSVSVVDLVAVGLWLSALKCAALDLASMDRLLGEAVMSALVDAKITVLQAVEIMQIDESQFRKALRGEGYRRLALNHLVKLGPIFMVHLTGQLMWLTAKQRATEIVETVGLRKGV